MLVNTRWFVSPVNFSGCVAALAFAAAVGFAGAQSSTPANPPLPEAAVTGLPALKAIGGGLLRIFGFQVYNAYLWTPGGAAFDPRRPYALDIHYLRNFSARQLAERSIDEMRGQGVGHDGLYAKWMPEMMRVFADVKEGDRLTGVATAARSARFFLNGRLRGEIADPDFTDAFFGIWLSEKSSQPRMRSQLLGKPD
jgi:hypothetical protein